MKSCPICSAETPGDGPECPRCHLSAGLFDSVRAAIDVPPNDPEYVVKAREVAEALGAEATPERLSGPARLSQAARFLSMPAGSGPARGPADAVERPAPTMPALPAAPDAAALRRRIDEYLQIARREGIDLSAFRDRIRLAVETQNREQLEGIDRELFVHLAAALTREYEAMLERKAELSALTPTATIDTELVSCRASLAFGDLAGAQRRLVHIEQTLAELEDEWATVQILVAEGELLADTTRELGGDPGPAMGPLDEGRRLARSGRKVDAEPILARAVAAQWTILEPRLSLDLDRLKEVVLRARAAGVDTRAPSHSLASVAAYLKERNYASAVASYRHAREWVERSTPPASIDLAPAAEPPVPTT